MTRLTGLIFFFVFFIGANVLSKVGFEYINFFYLIIVLTIITLAAKGGSTWSYANRKVEYHIIIFILLTLAARAYGKILQDSVRSAVVLLAPPLIYLLIPKEIITIKDLTVKKVVLRILILFYVIECLLAVYEFATRSHVFLWVDSTFGTDSMPAANESFRAIAIHSAPLTNALVVTILNAFFITSPLKDKYKFVLWGLGLLATLAFNARMAVLINFTFLFFYLLRMLYNRSTKTITKIFVYGSVMGFLGLLSYLILYKGLGDRLFKSELVDESSAQKRLDLFAIFQHREITDFLLGHSMKDFNIIKTNAGLKIIENFWVCEVLLFGIVFVAILIILYLKLLLPYFKTYTFFNAFLTSVSFLFLASTNNSLFTQYIPLLLFLICLNLFRPYTFKVLLPVKYVDVFAK